MSKMLIIAEKPSVAKDIIEAAGGAYKRVDNAYFESDTLVVGNAIGHLVELYVPEAETSGKNLRSLPVIPPQFSARPVEKTASQFNLVARLMARSDVHCIVNACDAGREGELIFRLIYDHARCKRPMKRMWMTSMTKEAIRSELNNLRPGIEYDGLYDAAKSRAEADWLIGINGSRGNTYLKSMQVGSYFQVNVGRVQTPTLAIIVDRENEILNFVPRDYYEIHATFGVRSGDYLGKWVSAADLENPTEKNKAASRILNKATADQILAKCRGVSPTKVEETSKGSSERAPKLFDLTTLQREANKRFKFSAKDTLAIAQSLYEKHKATTYPRTDAKALPEDYIDTVKGTLRSLMGSSYGEHAGRILENNWVKADKHIFDNSKISDHFAIIPTGQRPSGLSEAESKIYDMIVKRFVAIFHPAAEYLDTTRFTIVAGEKFKSTGRVLKNAGWKAVYGAEVDDDDKVAKLGLVDDGEIPQNKSVTAKALKTKPPPRHTEATLLSAMEFAGKNLDDEALKEEMMAIGLGTPATRAQVIEGLLFAGTKEQPREPYIQRSSNDLVPTSKAMDLITFLRNTGMAQLTSAAMTGEWERKLDLVAKGKMARSEFMRGIQDATIDMIGTLQGKAPSVPKMNCACPKCGTGIQSDLRTYQCDKKCLVIWKEISGRKLSVDEVTQLVNNGVTDVLKGFISKEKKLFDVALKLDRDLKVVFDFAPRVEQNIGDLPALKAACPMCGGRMHSGETRYACAKGDFSFGKTISGRNISLQEAEFLLAQKVTPKFNGFFSVKKNKVFSAGLALIQSKKECKVELYFDEPPVAPAPR